MTDRQDGPPVENATTPSLALDELEVGLGQRRLALDGACKLTAGNLYLVVGRSGSGKSSFARALLGFGDLTEPRSACRGQIVVRNAAGDELALWTGSEYDPDGRREIAFLPQAEKLGFVDGLSIADNLALFSHASQGRAAKEIEQLARQFHLDPLPANLASASGGERIRLSAIRGLLPRDDAGRIPALVIADEPTAGLDQRSSQAIAESLVELARSGQTVVMVITHEPEQFLAEAAAADLIDEHAVQIVECSAATDAALPGAARVVGKLRLEPAPKQATAASRWRAGAVAALGYLGAVALGPLAFAWGLLGLHRPIVLARQTLADAAGPGTQVFSLVGCLLVAGTVAYFIFERLPKPELVEPLLLPEIMAVTGHTLVRVVLPLGACSLIAGKLGAAQSARLAAAVRGGLLETLAMANWRVEAYALVPVVLAQLLAMAFGTAVALAGGVVLAAVVYTAGHEESSLPLAIDLIVDGLKSAPAWPRYAAAKVLVSGFLGGTIAALSGIVPSRAEDDVARAVHRTLLWSVLAVIATQCVLVLVEFAP